MKKTNWQKKILIIIPMFALLFLFYSNSAQAGLYDPIVFRAQTTIPGVFTAGEDKVLTDGDTSYIALMIKGLYEYGIGIAGILAAIMLMAGGIVWLTSAGSSEKISQAKNLMSGSVIGLVLLFSSWMMLRTINPALVDFRIRDVEGVVTKQPTPFLTGCCQSGNKAFMGLEEDCDGIFMKPQLDGNFGYQYYHLANGGTQCIKSGCCVARSEDGTTSCRASLVSNCSSEFHKMSCDRVDDTIHCAAGDVCSNSTIKNGDYFKNLGDSFVNYYCYDRVAWTANGKEGEPCGTDEGAKCTSQGGNVAGIPFCKGDLKHSGGARSCASNLYCCYDPK